MGVSPAATRPIALRTVHPAERHRPEAQRRTDHGHRASDRRPQRGSEEGGGGGGGGGSRHIATSRGPAVPPAQGAARPQRHARGVRPGPRRHHGPARHAGRQLVHVPRGGQRRAHRHARLDDGAALARRPGHPARPRLLQRGHPAARPRRLLQVDLLRRQLGRRHRARHPVPGVRRGDCEHQRAGPARRPLQRRPPAPRFPRLQRHPLRHHRLCARGLPDVQFRQGREAVRRERSRHVGRGEAAVRRAEEEEVLHRHAALRRQVQRVRVEGRGRARRRAARRGDGARGFRRGYVACMLCCRQTLAWQRRLAVFRYGREGEEPVHMCIPPYHKNPKTRSCMLSTWRKTLNPPPPFANSDIVTKIYTHTNIQPEKWVPNPRTARRRAVIYAPTHPPLPPNLLNGRIHRRNPAPALDPLLNLHAAASEPDPRAGRDLEPVGLPVAQLADGAGAGGALGLGLVVQRLYVRGRRDVVPLAGADLVELVVAPEEDVAAPVCVVGGEGLAGVVGGGGDDGGDVVHDGGGVGGADGHGVQADGHGGVVGLVPLEEPGEGGHLGRVRLRVHPAADAELACEAVAEGKGVGRGALVVGPPGFDGEVRRVAAGEDVCDFGLLRGAGVELLGGEQRGRVHVQGFGVEGEAQLARGVVAKGEGAAGRVADEAVVVACRDLGDGEALEGGDLVGHVHGALGSRRPGQAWYAELAFAGEVLCARGEGKDSSSGCEQEGMLESRLDINNLLAPCQVLRCACAVRYVAGAAPEGNPGCRHGLGALPLLLLRDGDRVYGAIGGEGDDAVARDGQRLEVLAAQCQCRLGNVLGEIRAPLQQVALLVNGSAKVPVQLDVAQQLAVEEANAPGRLDKLVVRVWRYRLSHIGAPSVDARVLPAPLHLQVLRADDVPIVVGRLCLSPGSLKFDNLIVVVVLVLFGVHLAHYVSVDILVCGGRGPQRSNGGYGAHEMLLAPLGVGMCRYSRAGALRSCRDVPTCSRGMRGSDGGA
ncbi:hypothetical protein B5807_08450 [Epicoccum nigrum]|uniref:Uncharacterized protein n=1 Tax=Epicoccum nigrum TaxID=105696 RepID=A0A1Y2LR02_EPING|nr:hypothetical protein B5807_08450 [Epicoccum nigrum]